MCDELSKERMGTIRELRLSEQIDFNNLSYYFKRKYIELINFVGIKGLKTLQKYIW